MKRTVYLAGPYASRELLAGYRNELRSIGYTVAAEWLDGKHEAAPGVEPAVEAALEEAGQWARVDLRDVNACDILVIFTAAQSGGSVGRGGRHVETGYALGRNKTVVLVGEPENVFHSLPEIKRVPNWHEAVLLLAQMLVDVERAAPQAATERAS